MHIKLDAFMSVTQAADEDEDSMFTVVVTRPTIGGSVATHTIISIYNAFKIAEWLYLRKSGKAPLVQDAFLQMNRGDAEFLISGITPAEWKRLFPKEDE